MNKLLADLQYIVYAMKHNLSYVLFLLTILWSINILNKILGYRLNWLGIHPRKIIGLPGIVFSPFLHGNFEHLFLNSIPLFVLINLMLLPGRGMFYMASIIIIIISGAIVWLIGKPGVHVGASGLIMGYFGYLFASSYHNPSIISVALSIVVLYYFGTMILLAIFPTERGVSWEGHVAGFVAGVFAAYLLV